jgi:hypothetical protein
MALRWARSRRQDYSRCEHSRHDVASESEHGIIPILCELSAWTAGKMHPRLLQLRNSLGESQHSEEAGCSCLPACRESGFAGTSMLLLRLPTRAVRDPDRLWLP